MHKGNTGIAFGLLVIASPLLATPSLTDPRIGLAPNQATGFPAHVSTQSVFTPPTPSSQTTITIEKPVTEQRRAREITGPLSLDNLGGTLHQIFEIYFEKGAVKIKIRSDSKSVLDARNKLREQFNGISLAELFAGGASKPLKVWDFDKKQFQSITVENITPLVLLGMSFEGHDGFAGRRLYLEDEAGKLGNFSIDPTGKPISLAYVNLIVNTFLRSNSEDRMKLRVAAPKYSGTYLDHFYRYDSGRKEYLKITDPAVVGERAARELVHEIKSNAGVGALTLALVDAYRSKGKPFNPDRYLNTPVISSMIHKGEGAIEGQRDLVRQEVRTFLNNAINGIVDSQRIENFRFDEKELKPGQWAITQPKRGKYRLTLVSNDDARNVPFRQEVAKLHGSTWTVVVKNLKEAAEAIEKAYQDAGGKIEVVAASHGNPGLMNFFDTTRGNINDFIESAAGKVSEIYAMGCHVGAKAKTMEGHLLRRLAGGLGVKTYAVDKQLQLKNSRYSLDEEGALVMVSPNPWEFNNRLYE